MESNWAYVCKADEIPAYAGVAALLVGRQVAIFHVPPAYYAISNYDPFSKTYVLSRGIIGDRAGVLKVASPIYKQSFALQSGECLDDPSVRLETYPILVADGEIYLSIQTARTETEEKRHVYQTISSQW